MTTANQAQKDTANKILRAYASQGAKFSSEIYQGSDFIFRAKLDCGTAFVVVGVRGAIKFNGWN
mgnify:CR=1 FL=1